jgi:hypothetical protein
VEWGDVKQARPGPTMSLLLGVLCSNAQIQLMDKPISDEEKAKNEALKLKGQEVKLEKEWVAVGNATGTLCCAVVCDA